jgi:serine/threonine protein kinase
LREPELLSKLSPHPNLIKVRALERYDRKRQKADRITSTPARQVFETVRTPGHFYLVEENLQTSVTLEALVESSPGGVLPIDSAWSVLEQLCSVVRSLHEPPVKVCHRDIKVSHFPSPLAI